MAAHLGDKPGRAYAKLVEMAMPTLVLKATSEGELYYLSFAEVAQLSFDGQHLPTKLANAAAEETVQASSNAGTKRKGTSARAALLPRNH
jgi:hypothetical protein